MIREVLAPVCSWWWSFCVGMFHAVLFIALTLGFGAWLWGGP